MPEYKMIDFDGKFSWIRLPNGKYVVDERYEQEFVDLFTTGENRKEQAHG